jgi:hypothetical protein
MLPVIKQELTMPVCLSTGMCKCNNVIETTYYTLTQWKNINEYRHGQTTANNLNLNEMVYKHQHNCYTSVDKKNNTYMHHYKYLKTNNTYFTRYPTVCSHPYTYTTKVCIFYTHFSIVLSQNTWQNHWSTNMSHTYTHTYTYINKNH